MHCAALVELSLVINRAKFFTTGLIHLLLRSETKTKCQTQDTRCIDQKILIRKLECILSFFQLFPMLATEWAWKPIPVFNSPSRPRGEFWMIKNYQNSQFCIDFCSLLQMFDKECARGNAPCRSSPRAPLGTPSPRDRGRGAWQIKTIWVPARA